MSRTPGKKLGELMNMTARELSQLSRAELRSSYQNVRKIVNSRIKTFEAHGMENALPVKIRGGLSSARGKSDEAVKREIMESMAWMRGRSSTYKGYRAARESFREKMQASMPDLDLSSEEKLDDYGEFMGEMAERYKAMWEGISAMVRDLYRDLTELNEDPREFMKNYDYWKEQVDAVNAAKNAARSGGRRRSNKFSTYMRQLKRGKIR